MATKNFYVFKNTDKKHENSPDYRICVNDANDDLQSVGALWKKEGPKSTYLSGQLDDGYQDREGQWFMSDSEKKQAEKYRRENGDSGSKEKSVDEKINDNYPDEDITPEDIPF